MSRLAVLSLALLSGCGTSIYIEHTAKGSSTVQGSPFGGVLNVFPALTGFSSIKLTDSQELKNQGVTKDDVKSVKVKKLTLRVASPNNGDFSWLQSIKFYAESNGRKDLIAQKEGVDKLGLKSPNPQFDCDLTDAELKPHVVAESMAITTEAVARVPSQDTTIEATVVLGIDAVVIK